MNNNKSRKNINIKIKKKILNSPEYLNFKKTKKNSNKIKLLSGGSSAGPDTAASAHTEMANEVKTLLKKQNQVLGNNTPIDNDNIINKLYQDYKPEPVSVAGKKPSGEKPSTSGTFTIENLIKLTEDKYKHYQSLPHKTLVVGSFHSAFNLDKIIVPDNVCICFATPLMEFGMNEYDGMLYHNFYNCELPQELFENIFEYKQTIIEDKLQVQPIDQSMNINYFQNSNWYYPGQKCPSIILNFDEQDVQDEFMGVYEITDEMGKYHKDISKMRNKSNFDFETEYTLSDFLKIYNVRPDHQYIFILSGCRFMERQLFTTYGNMLLRDLKIQENISVNVNWVISKKFDKLEPKLDMARKIGIPFLKDILNADTEDMASYFLNNTDGEGVKEDFQFYYATNYQHKFQTSRKNKIYLDILESIYLKKTIYPEQTTYLYYSPLMKTLRFMTKLITDTAADASKLTKEQIKNIISFILYTTHFKGNLMTNAFQKLGNFYFLLRNADLNFFQNVHFQKNFLNQYLVAHKLYLDIITEFPDFDIYLGPSTIKYDDTFGRADLYLDQNIHGRLTPDIREALSSIHLVNAKTEEFTSVNFTEYKNIYKLKFTYTIELINQFVDFKTQLKELTIENFNYDAATQGDYKLLEQFVNLTKLDIEFSNIQIPESILPFNFLKLESLNLKILKLTEPSTSLTVNLSLPLLQELTLEYEKIDEDKIIFNSRIPVNLFLLTLTGKNPQNFNFARFMCPNLRILELNYHQFQFPILKPILDLIISQSRNLSNLIIRNYGLSSQKIDSEFFQALKPISSVSGISSVLLDNFELETGAIIDYLAKNTIRYKLDVKDCGNYEEFKQTSKKNREIRKNMNFKYIL